MLSSRRGRVAAVSVCLALWILAVPQIGCRRSAPAPVPDSQPATATAPQAAYVLLGESPAGSTVAFARVIVEGGAACPDLLDAAGGPPIALSKRRNPHGFSVDVCEAEVPFGRSLAVAGSRLTLPAVRNQVSRVAVFGDTGCKPGENKQGDCSLSDPYWPFHTLAAAAAAREPDLVIHVGDYNYRGTPAGFHREVGGEEKKLWYYDAGDGAAPSEKCGVPGPYYSQNSTGNRDRDHWDAWRQDFFEPAAELLAAAPWVFARGNHELCSHAGPGWFYFLDASSDLPAGGGSQLGCPAQDGEGPAPPHLTLVPPRVIALGDLGLAVIDSSNACDDLANFTTDYATQLTEVASKLSSSPAWLVGHRPPWGVVGDADAPPFDCDGQPGSGPAPEYAALNRTLQCALGETAGPGAAGTSVAAALLPKLDLILAGHMHRYQSLTFAVAADRPPSLIIGNSGVQEDAGPPHGAFQAVVDGEEASGQSVEQFGYLELARNAAGTWTGAIITPDPAAWAPTVPACDPAAAPPPPLCVEGLSQAGAG